MSARPHIDADTLRLVGVLDPPDRRPVSEVVAESLYIGEGQRWDPDRAPYMIRPLDATESRYHNQVCFVGPARCGKTMALALGRYIYIATKRPRDSLLVHSSQDLARDISTREIERMHRHSAALAAVMTGRASDDNLHDKRYKNGAQINIVWPSGTQLASRTFHNVILTDYDRWPGNIDGDGSGHAQAMKRLQNSGSAGMCIVESSPGTEWADPTWRRPAFQLGEPLCHEFPATVSGVRADICSIYNNGTREWWYVPCSACGEYYPLYADIDNFDWDTSDDMIGAASTAGTRCCWCEARHSESEKRTENANGVWLAEGQVIDCNGKITGDSRLGYVDPSFSLGGGAACDQPRDKLILKYLQALRLAETVSDETELKASVNADIGAPVRPRLSRQLRNPHPLMERREELGKWVVPEGVRFLVAAVDVQAYGFVVQVMGYGPGESYSRERWVIDFYILDKSERLQDGHDDKQAKCDPARYIEDWHLLDKLLTKSYPLADDTGRRMSMMLSLCDSGGAEGVTLRAYEYWARAKELDGRNVQDKLRLVKGSNRVDAKLIEERYPDTAGTKRGGASRGDTPILFLNTTLFKDRLAMDLEREIGGEGYTHFPMWLKAPWFDALTREQRLAAGWTSPEKNEPWDLMNYADAGAIWGPARLFKPGPDGLYKVNWDKPPPWAMPWDTNVNVFHPDDPDQGSKHGAFSVDKWRF